MASKRILITGGGTGLGKGMAAHLARHDAELHLWGRREAVLKDAAAEIDAICGGQTRTPPAGVYPPLRRRGRRHRSDLDPARAVDSITGETVVVDGGHHLVAPSAYAGLSKMTDADWAKARDAAKPASAVANSQRSV